MALRSRGGHSSLSLLKDDSSSSSSGSQAAAQIRVLTDINRYLKSVSCYRESDSPAMLPLIFVVCSLKYDCRNSEVFSSVLLLVTFGSIAMELIISQIQKMNQRAKEGWMEKENPLLSATSRLDNKRWVYATVRSEMKTTMSAKQETKN